MQKNDDLLEGYRKNFKRQFQHAKDFYNNLAKQQQTPNMVMVSCCDSRIDPISIISANLGDIFSIRNVASLIPKQNDADGIGHSVLSGLEFAVKVLQVPNLVVLGHENCGGIAYLMQKNKKKFDYLEKWVSIGNPAKEIVMQKNPNIPADNLCHECELEAVKLSIENTLTYSWIKDAVNAKKLRLHGWHFKISDGELSVIV